MPLPVSVPVSVSVSDRRVSIRYRAFGHGDGQGHGDESGAPNHRARVRYPLTSAAKSGSSGLSSTRKTWQLSQSAGMTCRPSAVARASS